MRGGSVNRWHRSGQVDTSDTYPLSVQMIGDKWYVWSAVTAGPVVTQGYGSAAEAESAMHEHIAKLKEVQ